MVYFGGNGFTLSETLLSWPETLHLFLGMLSSRPSQKQEQVAFGEGVGVRWGCGLCLSAFLDSLFNYHCSECNLLCQGQNDGCLSPVLTVAHTILGTPPASKSRAGRDHASVTSVSCLAFPRTCLVGSPFSASG